MMKYSKTQWQTLRKWYSVSCMCHQQSVVFVTSFNTWLYGCWKKSWTRLWRQRGYIRGSPAAFRAAWVSCLLETFLDAVSVIILKMTVSQYNIHQQKHVNNIIVVTRMKARGGGRGMQPPNPLSTFFNCSLLFCL